MWYSQGELTNDVNISRECDADAKTVREYDQVLCATLLGRMVEPFSKRQERQPIIKAAILYLFDVSVAGSITRRTIAEERGEPFGKAFEHDVRFWRTKYGQDVDFIPGPGEVAIEVKGASRVDDRDLRSLQVFIAEIDIRQ